MSKFKNPNKKRKEWEWKHQQTKHHRLRKEDGGTDTSPPDNIRMVKRMEHDAWNILFDRYPVEVVAQKLQNIWLPPGYEVIIRRKE